MRRQRCQICQGGRARLHECVTCAKRGCGCCLFPSKAGRVCPGDCHVEALKIWAATQGPGLNVMGESVAAEGKP